MIIHLAFEKLIFGLGNVYLTQNILQSEIKVSSSARLKFAPSREKASGTRGLMHVLYPNKSTFGMNSVPFSWGCDLHETVADFVSR